MAVMGTAILTLWSFPGPPGTFSGSLIISHSLFVEGKKSLQPTNTKNPLGPKDLKEKKRKNYQDRESYVHV